MCEIGEIRDVYCGGETYRIVYFDPRLIEVYLLLRQVFPADAARIICKYRWAYFALKSHLWRNRPINVLNRLLNQNYERNCIAPLWFTGPNMGKYGMHILYHYTEYKFRCLFDKLLAIDIQRDLNIYTIPRKTPPGVFILYGPPMHDIYAKRERERREEILVIMKLKEVFETLRGVISNIYGAEY